MKRINTRAIVLKRINFGEADRIITVITPTQGKLSMFAKGVRRSKSKLAGGLELFTVADITYIDGKGDLKSVVSTRLSSHFMDITKNVSNTMVAYDFLKIIDKNSQEICDEHFYRILEQSLRCLSIGVDAKVVRAWFLANVLVNAGRLMNLVKQVDGSEFAEDTKYNFDHDGMGFAAGNGSYTPNHIKVLRLLVRVDGPHRLRNIGDMDDLSEDLVELLGSCMGEV